jgi:hypothetical protein
MSAMQAWEYRHITLMDINTADRTKLKAILVICSLTYAAILAGVAIDFPSGTIVGLIYLVGYGFGIIGR